MDRVKKVTSNHRFEITIIKKWTVTEEHNKTLMNRVDFKTEVKSIDFHAIVKAIHKIP
jgi:hypothetical protein